MSGLSRHITEDPIEALVVLECLFEIPRVSRTSAVRILKEKIEGHGGNNGLFLNHIKTIISEFRNNIFKLFEYIGFHISATETTTDQLFAFMLMFMNYHVNLSFDQFMEDCKDCIFVIEKYGLTNYSLEGLMNTVRGYEGSEVNPHQVLLRAAQLIAYGRLKIEDFDREDGNTPYYKRTTEFFELSGLSSAFNRIDYINRALPAYLHRANVSHLPQSAKIPGAISREEGIHRRTLRRPVIIEEAQNSSTRPYALNFGDVNLDEISQTFSNSNRALRSL